MGFTNSVNGSGRAVPVGGGLEGYGVPIQESTKRPKNVTCRVSSCQSREWPRSSESESQASRLPPPGTGSVLTGRLAHWQCALGAGRPGPGPRALPGTRTGTTSGSVSTELNLKPCPGPSACPGPVPAAQGITKIKSDFESVPRRRAAAAGGSLSVRLSDEVTSWHHWHWRAGN
jgi:hypothetical protein